MLTFKKNAIFIGLTIFIGVIYLLTLRGLPGNFSPAEYGKTFIPNNPPFESSLERGRYAQVITLAENHTFVIDQFRQFISPDVAWHSGHYFSPFPPGTSLMAVPLYVIGKNFNASQLFTFSISAIFSLLTALVIILICEQVGLSKKATIMSVLAYSLASVAWAYSVTLSAHPISAFFIAFAFYIFLKINPKNSKQSFLCLFALWIVYGINIFIDYPNLVIIFPIVVSSLIKTFYYRNDKEKIQLKIPMVIFYSLVSLMLIIFSFIFFNIKVYGQPIVFTNTFNIKVLQNRGIDISHLSNDLFKKSNYSTRFTLDQMKKGVRILLINTDRGIFFFSPLFIFSMLGLLAALRRKKYWVILASIVFFVDLLFYASFDDPWGGWAFGPRYLIPTIPMLAIAMGYYFDVFVFKKWFLKVIASLLFVYGVGVSLVGALTTNAVPPSVEAPYVKLPDNYILNWNNLNGGQISSFAYKFSVIHSIISPILYFLIIFLAVSFLGITVMWTNNHKFINHD